MGSETGLVTYGSDKDGGHDTQVEGKERYPNLANENKRAKVDKENGPWKGAMLNHRE
jgi:hypothetical protein